jgi:hypothetical protein
MNGNSVKERRSPAMNVAKHLWGTYRYILIWFWIVFAAIYVTINELIMRGYIPDEEIRESGSIWEGASFSPRIFLLVIGILLTIGSFNSFVSNGITRRSFGKGGLAFAGAMSLVCAVVNLLGYPIERFIIDISGAERVLVHPNFVVEGLTTLILYFGYFCAGWLIGTGFYRFHWFKGLLVCWLAVAIMVGMEIVSEMDIAEAAAADAGVKLLVLAALAALAAWLNATFLRKVAVKRKLAI